MIIKKMSEELVEYDVRFKDIEGYIGIYQVTDDGRVFSKFSERFLRPTLGDGGYLSVMLSNNGAQKRRNIHRIVADTFLENTENKVCVDHINGIKTDNRLENLRFATSSENSMNSRVRKNSKLQIKGIQKTKTSYRAYVGKNGERVTKTFITLEEAIAWRKAKEIELFGEYAYKA